MSDQPGKKKPDWRNQGPASPSAAAGRRDWHTKPDGAKRPTPPLSPAARLLLALGLLGIVVAALAIVISWLRPEPPAALILLSASYDTNLALPHNAYGYQALQELEKIADRVAAPSWWWQQGAGNLRLEHRAEVKADDTQNRLSADELWDKNWWKGQGNVSEKALVVFLALHGSTDAEGKACFHIDDRTNRRRVLSLERVLKSLEDTRLQEKKIVLILEPAQVAAHWPSGMLQNDFVRALKDKRILQRLDAQTNLVLLCASDVGQVSWASEEWRRTIFAHYLIEGLRGAADGAGERPRNQEVDAWELFSYVRDKVKAWSLQNRGVEQTPILLGGERRAAEIKLITVPEPVAETPPEQAPGQSFRASRAMKDAWEECQALRQMVPYPAIYSPQLWRYYLEALVRCEQLQRAGYSDERLGEIRRDLGLDQLPEKLRRQARFDAAADCLSVALPMPAVLGMQPFWRDGNGRAAAGLTFLRDKVQSLLQAKDKELRQKLLAEIKAWAREHDPQKDETFTPRLLSVQLYRSLLERLRQNLSGPDLGLPSTPAADCVAIAPTLIELFQKDRHRPAEVHFLIMLIQHLDRGRPPDVQVLQRALAVRLAAEETALAAPAALSTYPYSEVIQPWLLSRIEKADEQRRRGEDRLFSSHPEEHQRASKDLDEALQQYNRIRDDAAAFRTALDARDRALADLPFLAQWAALQRPSRLKEREQEVEAWLASVEGLSQEVKTLEEGLSRRDPALLTAVSERVNTKHKALKDGLANDSRKLAEDLQHLQHRLDEAEALLAVPLLLDSTETFDAVANREAILINTRKITATLNFKGRNDLFGHLLEENEPGRVSLSANRQRRMAVAALRPFEAIAAPEHDEPLLRLQHVAQAVRQVLQKSANSSDEEFAAAEESGDLATARAKLEQAEYRCRFLDAGAVPFLKSTPWTAPEALRRLRLHDLLVAQAERTLRDHWYAEEGDVQTTYYLPVAQEYLRTAAALVMGGIQEPDRKAVRVAAVEKVRQAISKKPSGVHPHPVDVTLKHLDDQPLLWTSEQEFALRWVIERDNDRYLDPLGIPMARLKLEGAALSGGDLKLDQRSAVLRYDAPLRVNIRPAGETGKKKQGSATLETFYRGQIIPAEVKVAFEPPDLIVNRFPPPKQAGVAVQLDKDFTYGAISIMLDCSGSMLEGAGADMDRFDHALLALEAVLTRIPKNTELSLIAFVDRRAGQERREPEFDFPVVRAPSSWDRETQLEGLMRKARSLRAEIDKQVVSPIAKALVVARDRGFSATFRGPRLILALTDGDDNYSGYLNEGRTRLLRNRSNQKAYNDDVGDYLEKAFERRQIAIHMVCFNQVDNEEAKNAREQFGRVQDKDAFNPPGSFKIQPKGFKLGEDLEKAIRPRLVLQEAPPPLSTGGIVANYAEDQALSPEAVPSGDYAPWMPGGMHETRFVLRRGDILPITVWRDPDHRIGFNRSLLGARRPHQAVLGNRQVSVLENDRNASSHQLNQLLVLDELPPPGVRATPALIQQPRPGFVWLETLPLAGKTAGPTRWYQQHGYAGLTYRVEVQRWPSVEEGQPRQAPAELKAWWCDRLHEPQLSDKVRVKRDLPLQPVSLALKGGQVTVEEVVFDEPQPVWISPGKREERKCLAIRLHHAPGKRFFVQLDDPQEHPEHGSEHQYYSRAGSATVLFWGLAPSEAYSLRVISVDALKQTAEPLRVELGARFENSAQDLGFIFRD
jgi:hypothetical protein